ncbi:MAG: bifunctional riboflavin kinase/FAD synthetase [Cytophagales bacterium]|nr:bifunctional riboflavin kinase/FAD synthetase [Cytophagales bacterium]
MRLIDDISDFPNNIQVVLTSGTFDGVHEGHQKILRQVASIAKAKGLQSVVLTYWPHPRFVLHQDDVKLKLLTTFEEKAELIRCTGIDYLVRIPFTEEFSQLEPSEFINKILKDHLNSKIIVIGYDHHFGKDRKGNFDYLVTNSNDFGFEVVEIPRHDIDHVGVSSTKIRKALLEGRVDESEALLGRHYSLKGQVVEGDRIGREIGFPTANLWVPESYKLIPAEGVYATEVVIKGEGYNGMTNIGIRPTVNGSQKRIEVNIFNFEGDLYDKELELIFVKKLRNETKFENVEKLQKQLMLDKEIAQKIFSNEDD